MEIPPPLVKTPPSPNRLYDSQHIHNKLMHSFHSRRKLSPSKTGFIVSADRMPPPPLLVNPPTP